MLKMKHPIVDIALVCSDFDAAVSFYRDQLGLTVACEVDIPESVARGAVLAPREFRQLRLKAGDTLIKLMQINSPPPERSHDFQSGVRWLTFILDDVPGTVEELKSRGVEFLSDVVSATDAKHVVCAKGPDGVLIELV